MTRDTPVLSRGLLATCRAKIARGDHTMFNKQNSINSSMDGNVCPPKRTEQEKNDTKEWLA